MSRPLASLGRRLASVRRRPASRRCRPASLRRRLASLRRRLASPRRPPAGMPLDRGWSTRLAAGCPRGDRFPPGLPDRCPASSAGRPSGREASAGRRSGPVAPEDPVLGPLEHLLGAAPGPPSRPAAARIRAARSGSPARRIRSRDLAPGWATTPELAPRQSPWLALRPTSCPRARLRLARAGRGVLRGVAVALATRCFAAGSTWPRRRRPTGRRTRSQPRRRPRRPQPRRRLPCLRFPAVPTPPADEPALPLPGAGTWLQSAPTSSPARVSVSVRIPANRATGSQQR